MRCLDPISILVAVMFAAALSLDLEEAMGSTAVELITRMSTRYTEIGSSVFSMRAEVMRRSIRGTQVHETRREYRLVKQGGRIRIDVFGEAKKPSAIIFSRGGRLQLYLSHPNAYVDMASTSSEASPIQEAVDRIHATLYGRFPDFAATQHNVTSVRESTVRTSTGRSQGYRIKLANVPGAGSRWIGELLIDGATSLVWRATLSKQGQSGESLEEEVEWKEIVVGDNVTAQGLQDLMWQPPPDSQLLRQVPAFLP